MKAVTRITFFDENNEKFFGEGPCRLLHKIEETGSLRAAAASMDLAYSKAFRMISNAEKALGYKLTERNIGGKSGGGSVLTAKGKLWLEKYEEYRNACTVSNTELYDELFLKNDIVSPKCGCIIMASGLGTRFGGNKLLSDFAGKPLIQWVLDSTKELFTERVVVTRHEEIAKLCKEQGISVVLHTLPNRNDTVKLGLQALGKDLDFYAFFPADQPLFSADSIRACLLEAKNNKACIIRPCHGESAGAPVFFPGEYYEELLQLPLKKGGNEVVKNHPDKVKCVPVKSSYELKDVDTPEDLEFLKKGLRLCLMLAKDYKKDFSPYEPFSDISDRKFWDGLNEHTRTFLLSEGEKALTLEYPVIYATDYMLFKRTGNRNKFEEANFERRYILNSLVLAECVENKGRFLDKILDGIFLICEESSWVLPAHNSYGRSQAQLILPDDSRPVLDLFACETGATLSVVSYLLGPALNKVSEFIVDRINSELRKRIIVPYLNEHFWWMGNGDEPMCNWTPWCVTNVLTTAFLNRALTTESEKRSIFEAAAESLDLFLKDYGDDGCCDEGALYYRHAGLCLFSALDTLNSVSNNAFAAIYESEKVKNLAAYISIAHVSDRYYFNFADCPARVAFAGVREYLFGKATKQQFLMDFASADYKKTFERDLLLSDESQKLNLFYRTQSIHFTEEVLAAAEGVSRPDHAPDIFYESAGLWIARNSCFSLAVKAGDNDDSHNHNDVGSLILYKDGSPVLVDIGVETYTAKTFSSERYDIWTMRSDYHNLPTISGKVQLPGEEHCATDVSFSFEGSKPYIAMNIEKAYGSLPAGVTYRRLVEFDKEKNRVTILDDSDSVDVVLNFITYDMPVIDGSVIHLGNATLDCGEHSDISYEILPITDERLKWAWDHDLYRIFIKTTGHSRITIQ